VPQLLPRFVPFREEHPRTQPQRVGGPGPVLPSDGPLCVAQAVACTAVGTPATAGPARGRRCAWTWSKSHAPSIGHLADLAMILVNSRGLLPGCGQPGHPRE